MTHFEQITRSPEALATFLGLLPVLSSPWEEEFHSAFCDACPLANCDACPHPSERINPLWWLRREAAE
jgi:hypothetical protein